MLRLAAHASVADDGSQRPAPDFMVQVNKLVEEAALQTEMATYGRVVVAAIVEMVQPAILCERIRARLEIAPADSLKVFANVLLEQLQALNEYECHLEDNCSLQEERRPGSAKMD